MSLTKYPSETSNRNCVTTQVDVPVENLLRGTDQDTFFIRTVEHRTGNCDFYTMFIPVRRVVGRKETQIDSSLSCLLRFRIKSLEFRKGSQWYKPHSIVKLPSQGTGYLYVIPCNTYFSYILPTSLSSTILGIKGLHIKPEKKKKKNLIPTPNYPFLYLYYVTRYLLTKFVKIFSFQSGKSPSQLNQVVRSQD